MYGILLFIHIAVSVLLILAVLMQSGKGGGLSGAFGGGGGGGGSQSAFGGRGAVDFLGKATWILGSTFMVLSLLLATMSSGDGEGPASLIQKSATPPAAFPAAAAPGTQVDPTGTPVGDEVAPAEIPGSGDGSSVPEGDAPESSDPTSESPSSPGGN